VIEGLHALLEGSGQPGLAELRACLQEVCGGPGATGCLLEQQRLKTRVYRLRIETGGGKLSLVVKRMSPETARRNQLISRRWLPAIGLSGSAPRLLGVAAERSGESVWHAYQDVGDWPLERRTPDPRRVRAALELVARLHTRAAAHPVLPECRRYAGDLGIYYFTSNVCDAISGLEALRAPRLVLSVEQSALCDRLLARLYALRDDGPRRAQALAEVGGPDTLLHGDLWTTNTFVCATADGPQAQLIDWDHAGVGPVSYDLSTFLYRFPAGDRRWILESYRQAVEAAGWRLPAAGELNLLFGTAECARYANRAIWPAVALLQDQADWGFAELAEIERWFEALEPALPL
jgi:hypothetical protein